MSERHAFCDHCGSELRPQDITHLPNSRGSVHRSCPNFGDFGPQADAVADMPRQRDIYAGGPRHLSTGGSAGVK